MVRTMAGRLESIGKELDGVSVKVGPNGELSLKGDNVFIGYFKVFPILSIALKKHIRNQILLHRPWIVVGTILVIWSR